MGAVSIKGARHLNSYAESFGFPRIFYELSPDKKIIGFAGVLRLNNAAAARLDLFRFGVVKMLERRVRRRLRFSLSQKQKISISKLQASKNVTLHSNAAFFDDCFLIWKQLLLYPLI